MAGRARLQEAFHRAAIEHLSHMDAIHDFKTFLGLDRPNNKRGDPDYYYWRGFKHYILVIGSGGNPKEAELFNGCPPLMPAAGIEDAALDFAIEHMNPREVRVPYSGVGDGPNRFYERVAEELSEYLSDGGRPGQGKIPLVVDTEYTLNKAIRLREFIDNFVVCKNKENFSDPGRSFSRNYVSQVEERNGDQRRYSMPKVDTRIGDIVVTRKDSGEPTDVEILYEDANGDVIMREQYTRIGAVLPNSKAQCQGAFENLLKKHEYKRPTPMLEYCPRFKDGNKLPGEYANINLLQKLALQLIKKRMGDQLQVASCMEKINYEDKNGVPFTYGGEESPCVFWSYDRVAVAFAIVKETPCAFQDKNGSVRIFLPPATGGAQKGGAPCTRSLIHTDAELVSSSISTPIVREINSSPACLNRYVEMHFEPGSIYYHPIQCINLIKLLSPRGVNRDMFKETFLTCYGLDDSMPKIQIEDDDEAAVTTTLTETPGLVFYSTKYKVYIVHTQPREDDHHFMLYRTSANGSMER
jgi:hypothetical protein